MTPDAREGLYRVLCEDSGSGRVDDIGGSEHVDGIGDSVRRLEPRGGRTSAAKREPLIHLLRCLIKSGTVIGTSVKADACGGHVKAACVRCAQPCTRTRRVLDVAKGVIAVFLGENFDAQDAIFRQVQVSLEGSVRTALRGVLTCARMPPTPLTPTVLLSRTAP